MILELVKREMRRYELRNSDVIYAHMLERPIDEVDKPVSVNGYMIIGELIHLGIEKLLGGNGAQFCKMICTYPERLHPKAKRFVLRGAYDSYCVVICGNPDGFIDGFPVEVKTTRSHRYLRDPPVQWLLRARVYATLAEREKCYLSIIDVYKCREAVFECRRIPLKTFKRMVGEWLSGNDILKSYYSYIVGGCRPFGHEKGEEGETISGNVRVRRGGLRKR